MAASAPRWKKRLKKRQEALAAYYQERRASQEWVTIIRYGIGDLPSRVLGGVVAAKGGGVLFDGRLYHTEGFQPGDFLAWDKDRKAPFAVAPEHPESWRFAAMLIEDPCFPKKHRKHPWPIKTSGTLNYED